MKHITSAGTRLASVLAIGLVAASGSAFGQTTTAFYGANVQGGTYDSTFTLGAASFDASQYNHGTGAITDTGTIAAFGGNGLGVGRLSQNYSFSASAVKGAGTIESFTLYLYINSISPNSSSNSFTIYNGLNALGGVAGSFILTEPTSELSFAAITIPASAFTDGTFSIGYDINSAAQPAFIVVSDSPSADPTKTPGFAVTVNAIPEPSAAALLGAMGFLSLLRRRRG